MEVARACVHHVGISHVAIGEHHRIDVFLVANAFQLAFRDDGNAVRIERSGERGGVAAAVDTGDLGRGECYDAAGGVVAAADVEIVKIPPCGPHDHQSAWV